MSNNQIEKLPMVDHTLQQIIYGTAVVAGQPTDETAILALSDPLTPEQVNLLLGAIAINPMPVDGILKSQSVAMVSCNLGDDTYYVIARAHFQDAAQQVPVRQFLLIPHDEVQTYQDFEGLTTVLNQAIPAYTVTNAPVDRVHIMQLAPPSKDKQVMVIKTLLDDLLDNDFARLLAILSAILEGQVVIKNFPQNATQRLLLVRGLRLLLPLVARPKLSFTTYTATHTRGLPLLSFSDDMQDTAKTVLDWSGLPVVDASSFHPYTTQLNQLWHDNVIELVDALSRFDEIATVLYEEQQSLSQLMTTVTSRYQLDTSALQGEKLPVEQVLSVFESDVPMPAELQTAYLILLLESNFESRDTGTAQAVSRVLEDNDDLNASLEPFINTSIEEQPDAVYAFVRAHLHNVDEDGITPRWLQRLHDAAKTSMDVAIASKDALTIKSWLTLISREPLRYELNDILQGALVDAQKYVADSPELAQEILEVAIKRQPDMVEDMLANEALVAVLPETIHQALLEHDPAAIENLNNISRNLFVLSVRRALDADVPAVTSPCVRSLWQIYTQRQTNILPVQFRARTLLHQCIEQPSCFVNGAYATLLTLSLADGEYDDLFHDAVNAFSGKENFASALAQAFQQSNRETNTIIDMMSSLVGREAITPQIAINTLATLLSNRNWDGGSQPYTAQLSRLMSQHPDTDTNINVLWKLLELSAANKNEQMLKVSLRRLLDQTSNLVAEAQIVENIKTIRRDSQWSASGKSVLVKWWRAFAREQGTGQLQKIEKLLEGNRSLEDLRAIAQTSIAMRRIIGNRSLEEFSEVVASTYALLQALSEGFDPADKLVDSITIRNEIEARSEELPVNLRPVLSTNLRELAQLVTVLSDNRSKPSIIRSDDALERQLVTGEQDPSSAIDVMRWLSGYLDGIQKPDEE